MNESVRIGLEHCPTLAELAADPARALGLERGAAARALAQVEGLAAILRLAAALAPGRMGTEPHQRATAGTRWLSPDEAATLASVPRRAIYRWSRRADWRAFSSRPSRKVLRIEERGFRNWLERQSSR